MIKKSMTKEDIIKDIEKAMDEINKITTRIGGLYGKLQTIIRKLEK